MNQKGLKKWAVKALHSTLKEGLHEKREKAKVSRSRFNLLCIYGRMFRQNTFGLLVRKLRDSDRLKAIGLTLFPPCFIFSLYILFAKLLGITNEILRTILIWLFLFSLFCSPAIVALYFYEKEKRRAK